MPRLVASDVDGTLLDNQGRLSRRTIAAVRALTDTGLVFVLVTARPPRWMHDLTEVVSDHGVALCSNGAFVYDVARGVVMSERTLARHSVLELVTALRREVPGIGFAVESANGFAREPSYADVHPRPPGTRTADVEELLDDLPGKLLARAPDLDGEQFLKTVTDVVGDAAVVAYSGASGLAEISAAGVTKAAVLAEWAAERDVAADQVWAFGDMPNDLPMLEWAGTAFAVGNAHRDVVAAASYVVGDNDHDGVAEVLELIV